MLRWIPAFAGTTIESYGPGSSKNQFIMYLHNHAQYAVDSRGVCFGVGFLEKKVYIIE